MIIDATGSFCVRNIRYLRKKFCISRTGLARLIGMSPTILRDIEEGRYVAEFRDHEVRWICSIFNISVVQLFHCDLTSGQTSPPEAPYPGDPVCNFEMRKKEKM